MIHSAALNFVHIYELNAQHLRLLLFLRCNGADLVTQILPIVIRLEIEYFNGRAYHHPDGMTSTKALPSLFEDFSRLWSLFACFRP